MNLTKASKQWAVRPVDETFMGLEDLRNFLQAQRKASVEKTIPLASMRPKAIGEEICLVGDKGKPCQMTHWSFTQLCQYAKGENGVGAPADYLRSLPPELAVKNLAYGLNRPDVDNVQLLLHGNGSWAARAVTSPDYSRLWNLDLLNALTPATQAGWRTPPARPSPSRKDDPRIRIATEADIIPNQKQFGISVKVGDSIAPAGVYCGDRDMFIFLVHPTKIIDDGGSGLMRGVFLQNSEVRACAFKATAFLFEGVCGNHIVWNASGVTEFKFNHRGDIYSRFNKAIGTTLNKYIEQDTGEEEHMIHKAKQCFLGKNVDEATEKLFNNKRIGLTMESIMEAMEFAKKWEHTAHAPPTTAWGFVHGLTRLSQATDWADKRAKLDSAGGKVLAMAMAV